MANSKPKKKFWEKPWDVQAWWTSPTRIGLSLAERGLYRELLDYQWVEGSLPSEVSQLAGIAGRPIEEVEPAWEAIRGKFKKLRNGRLVNLRLEVIRKIKVDSAQKRSAKAQKGAIARHRKKRDLSARSRSQAVLDSANELTKERGNEETSTAHTHPLRNTRMEAAPNGRPQSVCEIDPEEFLKLKAAYPKDTKIHAGEATEAWHETVECAANPSAVVAEVWAGLERMKASGKQQRFLPSLADFLRQQRFRERWEKQIEGKPLRSEADRLRELGI